MATGDVTLLVFELAGHRYGLPASVVCEVCPAATLVPLPQGPSAIEGVLDVRGALVPVFDLRARLAVPARPIQPDEHLIIARASERRVAMRVDRALEVAHVPAHAVETPDGELPFVRGAARLAQGLIVIYDLDAFLSRAESAQLTSALRDLEPS